MMMNMFSSFNPTSWMLIPLSWTTTMSTPMIMMNQMWKTKSKKNMILKMTMMKMNKQFETLLNKSMKMNLLVMLAIMMTIMVVNTMSMYPYVYAPSAMPQMCVPVALSMWMSINLKKYKTPMKAMAGLLPKNTPTPLVPPMILIETTSTLIQPITLSVRLMANITAGHILVVLVSYAYTMKTMIPIMAVQMILSTMEMCVALIQGYVFSMLLIMFNK